MNRSSRQPDVGWVRIFMSTLMLTVSMVLAGCASAQRHDRDQPRAAFITPDDLPPAVKAGFSRDYPGAVIDSVVVLYVGDSNQGEYRLRMTTQLGDERMVLYNAEGDILLPARSVPTRRLLFDERH